MRVRKMVALLYLALAPCLLWVLFAGSCHWVRDWTIAVGIVKIAGRTENRVLEAAEIYMPLMNRRDDIPAAKKDIRKVFSKHWQLWANEARAKRDLKQVCGRYNIPWSDY